MQPERLKKRQDFVNVANQGQKIISSGLILQFLKVNDPDALKVGFTATKKLGNAVVRNRVKRRLRVIVQKQFSQAKRGYYYVLIGRSGTLVRKFADLEKDLADALKRVK